MKKFYSVVIMFMFALMANAQNVAEVEGLNYSLSADQTAVVTGSVSKTGSVVIPNTVKYEGTTYSVTGVSEEAFKGTKISSVVIAASVKQIGLSAFEECTSLSSVTLEEGSVLEAIGSSVFATCTNLSKVVFAKDGMLNYIGNSAFTACSSLKEINFPSSLKTIDFYAFGECTSLKEFTFDDNAQITTIEPFAFNSCSKLAVVNLPASLTSIADMAFTSCKALETINSSIAEPFSIGDAFDYGSKQTLYVPNGTKTKYEAASGWKRFKNIVEKEMGIEGVTADVEQNNTVYDLQGRRVNNPTEGIYIVNGKKIAY